MTPTKVQCPECDAELRPAKPLPVGKSVKCPKCGAAFVVGGDRPAPVKANSKSAPTPPAPVKKKPSKPAGLPVAPVLPHDDDDDEGGGSYAVIKEEEAGGGGPAINYAPDVGIRDLRGPAMQQVVDPSNKMIFIAVLGFFGWLVFAIIMLIPLLFPLQDKDKEQKEKDKAAMARAGVVTAAQKKEDKETSFLKIGKIDFRDITKLRWYLMVPCLLPLFLGMAYSATLAMGAVKVQNLESRAWGLATAIMAIIPLNVAGLMVFATLALNLLLDFDEAGASDWIILGLVLTLIYLSNLGVGVWMLKVLNNPEVIAGFEYRAE